MLILLGVALLAGLGIAAATAGPKKQEAPASGYVPITVDDIKGLHTEIEKIFGGVGVKWTAPGNVAVDNREVYVDLSMLTMSDAMKAKDMLPRDPVKGRLFIFKTPVS